MSKKFLDNLVHVSFRNNTIDEKTVLRIADLLTRSELKAYIHALKEAVRENTVTVVTPKNISKKMKDMFEKEYTGKKLEFLVKPDILLGTRIIDNDMVYDNSLKGTFKDLTSYIRE